MGQNAIKDEHTEGEARPAPFRPTPADTLLLRSLAYKSGYFARKGLLAADGSFFYSDMRLAQENMISAKTVMRSKRRLCEMGKIRFESGKHNGQATRYWILAKDDFLAPDRLTDKQDTLSIKAGQHVPPIINNNLNNIECSQTGMMTDEQEKERHDAFQECIRGLRGKHGQGTKTSV